MSDRQILEAAKNMMSDRDFRALADDLAAGMPAVDRDDLVDVIKERVSHA